MNKFDPQVWHRFGGDLLIILTYILGPLFFIISGTLQMPTSEDPNIACGLTLIVGIIFYILANLISAGAIK